MLVIRVPTVPGTFLAARQAFVNHEVKHFVTVEEPAVGVHDLEAVGVAVQRDTVVGLLP
jgi:hypothetical protein